MNRRRPTALSAAATGGIHPRMPLIESLRCYGSSRNASSSDLGGTRPLKADVRVVAATNRDLGAALVSGAFREDLYYRLSVFEIALPPLRERREDILPLAAAFLEDIGPTVGRPAAGISREARDALLAYPWPGNVRELRNALERASILCDGGLITVEHLPIAVRRPDSANEPSLGPASPPSARGQPTVSSWSGWNVT